MRVLLLGATGFIGSQVLTRLREAGHEVLAVARPGRTGDEGPGLAWLAMNIAQATDLGDWLPHLDGIDAVVNCAGLFQDSPRDSTAGVHASGPAALYRTCEASSVKRVVHVSAVGVEREQPSAFSATKFTGDQQLMALDLDGVILRPSVVLGRNAYGSGALFRGLAALPVLPVLPDAGALQVVQLDDLTRTVLRFLDADAPTRLALDVVGPERLEMAEVVQRYRRWLGWRRALEVRSPAWAMRAGYLLGDFAGVLGWRPPIRSNARLEMARGAVGDPAAWVEATDIRPLSLDQALAREPAPVQERWFARLYFLKPLVMGVLALYWFSTGVVSLGPGWERGIELLDGTFLGPVAALTVASGAILDMLLGLGMAVRRTARPALWGAVGVSVVYAVAGTIAHPTLWADPLGPMLKIGPIMVLQFVALAILEER